MWVLHNRWPGPGTLTLPALALGPSPGGCLAFSFLGIVYIVVNESVV